MRPLRAIAAVTIGGAALALAACGTSDTSGSGSTSSSDALTVLIGSSGEAETTAVKDAVAAWSAESGIAAEVSVASDLNQQLSQGFAGGNPADVFYLTNDSVATFAANGSLEPFIDQLSNKDDFYPSLLEAYTFDGKVYAAPKDFSTLQLLINTDAWTAAGLTDADIPTTWDQLHAVAQKLTTDSQTGLVTSPEFARIGAFMAQAGGWLVDEEGAVTVDSPENAKALAFVQSMLKDGSLKYSTDVGAGWGGEAFGNGSAAMTIEGNWITGALKNDFPDVAYRVAALPEGPAGPGTMQFDGGWAIAADSDQKADSVKLVEFLTSTDQQLAFSEAFGVMPSVQSAADAWKTANPDLLPFIEGADYSRSLPNLVGITDVVADLNAGLQTLATGDPAEILSSAQANLEAIAP